MLPKKTFYVKDCVLSESDFDVNSEIKMQRVMEFMQDAATAHADALGIGWDVMNRNGLFWVLSKVKIVLSKQVTRDVRHFKLYTWPVAPDRLYMERRFSAVDDNGDELFCCCTLWMIVERDSRKIASREVVAKYYDFDFDNAVCCCDADFERVRLDDTYALRYQSQVRRSMLDLNKHVNNTKYIDYATDVLEQDEQIVSAEIVYHKELLLGDTVQVFVKRDGNAVYVAGARGGQTCFTVRLTLR